MARKREFDPEAALEAAMAVFWKKGYANTSVSELLAAMKIHRFSMYETFGDKDALFVKALQLYRGRWAAFIEAKLAGPSPRAALLSLFRAMGAEVVADKLRRGCMISNSLFEIEELPAPARKLVTDGLLRLEAAVAQAIARAQEAGEIDSGRDPHTLARFLIASVNGVRSAGKMEQKRERLTELIELALTVI